MNISDPATEQMPDPPARMPLRCRLDYHKWSVWSAIKVRSVKGLFGEVRQHYQTGECLACGMSRKRELFGL